VRPLLRALHPCTLPDRGWGVTSPAPLTPRLPLVRAAETLGCSRRHALRLGLDGVLELADVRRPGAQRPRYVVTHESLDRFLANAARGKKRVLQSTPDTNLSAFARVDARKVVTNSKEKKCT